MGGNLRVPNDTFALRPASQGQVLISPVVQDRLVVFVGPPFALGEEPHRRGLLGYLERDLATRGERLGDYSRG